MKTRPQITIVEPRIRIAGLAQRLAEELEDPARVDEAHHPAAEAGDVAAASRASRVGTASQPGIYLITEISGWVASSVWVKT